MGVQRAWRVIGGSSSRVNEVAICEAAVKGLLFMPGTCFLSSKRSDPPGTKAMALRADSRRFVAAKI